MSYIGNEPIVSATRTVTEVSATAGQTVFTANGGYTVGFIDVFVNGSKLTNSDFTATNGTTITLNEAAQASDIVRLEALGTFLTGNHVPLVGDSNITGNVNVSGNVGIGTNSPSYKLDVTGQGRATTGWAVSSDGSAFTPSGLNAIPNYGTGFITSTSYTTLAGFGGVSLYTNQAERMRIDGFGRVTMPFQPAFHARYTGGIYTYGTNVIQWNATTVNIGNHFSTSTHRFTAPVAGNYFFTLNIHNTTSQTTRGFIRKNGAWYLFFMNANAAGGYEGGGICSCVIPLAVGDYVDVAGDVSVASGFFNNEYSGFSGYLIG